MPPVVTLLGFYRILALTLSLAGGFVACSDTRGEADGGAPDSAVDDGSPADAQRADTYHVDPTVLPLDSSSIKKLSFTGGNRAVSSTVLKNSSAGQTLLFSWADLWFTTGGIYRVDVSPGGSFATPVPLSLTVEDTISTLSHVVTGGLDLVYYVTGLGHIDAEANVERRTWNGSKLSDATPVKIPEVLRNYSGPQFIGLKGGATAVVYWDATQHEFPYYKKSGKTKIAFSSDGLQFGAPLTLPYVEPWGLTVARVGNGDLVLFFTQNVTGSLWDAYLSISKDHKTWGSPVLISEMRGVKAGKLLARMDGAVDVYYTLHTDQLNDVLFRRCIRADGSIGPQQQVLVQEEVMNPIPHRLDNSGVLITFLEPSQNGFLLVIQLFGDAPCP